jgi:hypothetical protein
MLDSALLITLFVILAAAVLSAIVAARVRDPCVRQWHGYPVKVLRLDSDPIAGGMQSEANGLEITFADELAGPDGATHHSFVLYSDEYQTIDKIVRYLDALTPDELRRRNRALRHAYRPGIHRRMVRRARNWINTLKDALADAAAAVVGHAGLQGQAGRAGSTSAAMAGALGRAYDPLLERHIGHRVVVVVDRSGDRSEEYVGVFREYSLAFLSIADVEYAPPAEAARTADLLLSRPRATVRAAAEPP